jgi:hypothetical protein
VRYDIANVARSGGLLVRDRSPDFNGFGERQRAALGPNSVELGGATRLAMDGVDRSRLSRA